MVAVFWLGLGACDSGLTGDRPLQRGMSEQEVDEPKGSRCRTVPYHYVDLRHCHAQRGAVGHARLVLG
jgi:hypothetical protein